MLLLEPDINSLGIICKLPSYPYHADKRWIFFAIRDCAETSPLLAILNEHMSIPTVRMCIHVHDCWVRLVNVSG